MRRLILHVQLQAVRAIQLDLERLADRAQLVQPGMFLAARRSSFIVLDEVQFAPDIFASLRREIAADRRPGRFLLLGSASGHLLRQQTDFEIRFSQTLKPTRGFWPALADLKTTQAYVVAPVERRHPLAKNVEVIPIGDIPAVLAA